MIGLFLGTAAVGFGLFSALRYKAKASEFVTPPLVSRTVDTPPKEILRKEALISEIEAGDRYRFSMVKVGGLSQYEVYELDITAQGTDAQAQLRIKERNGTVENHEKTLDAESFKAFWTTLRRLETAQLTDLSPYTEVFTQNLDSPKLTVAAAVKTDDQQTAYRMPSIKSSATYRFTFQDGRHDYPNSFEVHAPEALEDTRYRQLKNATHRFVNGTFDEVFD